MNERIEVRKGAKYWRFVVVGDNNEIIATSEHYVSRRNAYRGAATLIGVCKRLFENLDGTIIDGPARRAKRKTSRRR